MTYLEAYTLHFNTKTKVITKVQFTPLKSPTIKNSHFLLYSSMDEANLVSGKHSDTQRLETHLRDMLKSGKICRAGDCRPQQRLFARV